GLQRDLDIRCEAPTAACALDDSGNRVRFNQRRRAAAEEDAGKAVAARIRGVVIEFAQQRIAPARMVDGGPNMAVEIAIRTLQQAERPMHIEAEARLVRVRSPDLP